MDREQRSGRGTETLQRYEGYTVYDRDGDKIGKVDDLFVDENDQLEYIGVKMGLFGLQGTTLIPWEAVRVDEGEHRIEVSADKETVKNGPAFENDEDITPDYEEWVYSHYGLQQRAQTAGSSERGGYEAYYGQETDEHSGEVGPGMRMGDTETGEFRGHGREQEGVNQPGDDLEDEDELRVQRVEGGRRAGARERAAGRVSVREREEVSVERVPVEEGREASEAQIGDDEVVMPVVEEEVVTDKRAVVKEEIRVRKDVVEDEEVVEEDVRREEVDIEDKTERGRDVGRGTDP